MDITTGRRPLRCTPVSAGPMTGFLCGAISRSCPCVVARPRWAPGKKGADLVRGGVSFFLWADGRAPVQPGQPVEPVVRFVCAVCGGNGRAHLRPPGHHGPHAVAQVPKPVLVSRTRGQGCEGSGLYSGFLLPLSLLSPPCIPSAFFAPAGNSPFPGPGSPSACLCYPGPLCPSAGPRSAWPFCLCSGGALRQESCPLTQAVN